MYGNESLVNAHFIIGSKIYMKSGHDGMIKEATGEYKS